MLQNIDSGCPYKDTVVTIKQGHPFHCFEEKSGCTSPLRILRAASPHYPILRSLLRNIYDAIKFHKLVVVIDKALCDAKTLMIKLTADKDDVNIAAILSGTDDDTMSLRAPDLEVNLLKDNIKMIAEYEKAINDQNEKVCCSCQRLLWHKTVTKVKDSDKTGKIWQQLEKYMTQHDPSYKNRILYMCNHCKPLIHKDTLPASCVLNNLHCEPVPDELKNLDPSSCQLIQLAKSYQTVVRLGTYTSKVPIYNSLKACKGTMFFLPLPLHKSMSTLENAEDFRPKIMPDPELFVILNGQPTKNKTIWRSLVDINRVKAAFEKLKQINWLYANVEDNESLDDVSKKVIEVANSATGTMIEEATKEDVAGFQSYTIRNLNSKISSDSDIAQYKLQNV